MISVLKLVRRADGVSYEFYRDGEFDGFPSYRRADIDVCCRRLLDFGWVVCTDSGQVLGRPFADAGRGDLPPSGMWVSGRGDRAYVYDLTAC